MILRPSFVPSGRPSEWSEQFAKQVLDNPPLSRDVLSPHGFDETLFRAMVVFTQLTQGRKKPAPLSRLSFTRVLLALRWMGNRSNAFDMNLLFPSRLSVFGGLSVDLRTPVPRTLLMKWLRDHFPIPVSLPVEKVPAYLSPWGFYFSGI